jgi:DNA-binding transcriptional ArsR family regulator
MYNYKMYSVAPQILLKWLRAAGESSRVRLLALCGEAALSVSDLAQALTQSEPRVSRHLKILCEAGLVERLRQGQWVHYRVSANAEAASFVRGLLAQLDRRDPQLVRDRSRTRTAHTAGAHAAGTESRLGRALAELLTSGGLSSPAGSVLIVGVEHPELLERAASAARQCTAIAHSRRAAQGARAHAERRGFACRILQAGSREGSGAADLARAGSSFDTILLDHPDASGEMLARLLAEARAVMAAGGRLWIFEGYDALESSRGRIVEHPLARLRRLLGEAGFQCERISPVEADGEHVLAAVGRAAVPVPRRAQQGAGQ